MVGDIVIITTNSPAAIASLRLLQLVSPALPVGAYSFSQGLEQAVQASWVTDSDSFFDWISGIGTHSFASLELPLLLRLYPAWQEQNNERINHWNQFLLAARETKELCLEDQQMGEALKRLLDNLLEGQLSDEVTSEGSSFVTQFARAAVYWHIPVVDAGHGLAWSYVENQVAAGLKLVLFGQTEGQRLLVRLSQLIPDWMRKAESLQHEHLVCSAPGLVRASTQHEYQYSRLFRS